MATEVEKNKQQDVGEGSEWTESSCKGNPSLHSRLYLSSITKCLMNVWKSSIIVKDIDYTDSQLVRKLCTL